MKKQINTRIELILLTCAAFAVAYVPIAHVPFSWAMTFFHEISHGLAAMLTGGSIERIQLNSDGSGLCYTRGGWRFVTAFAGYSGAVGWGMFIYIMAATEQQKARVLAILLAAFIIFSALFYSKDVMTWAILASIFTLFMLVIKLRSARIAQWLLKFIGLYVLCDAIRAPLHLIDGQHVGDGATLQGLTLVPEIVWVVIWLVLGVMGIGYLLIKPVQNKMDFRRFSR